jgi:hypothetical protein
LAARDLGTSIGDNELVLEERSKHEGFSVGYESGGGVGTGNVGAGAGRVLSRNGLSDSDHRASYSILQRKS